MMKLNSDVKKPVLKWDDLLEQATEDISSYLWAVDTWLAPPQEYDSDYLLLLALCSHTRGRAALDLVTRAVPEDDKVYQKKLENMWAHAEGLLSEQILENGSQITRVVNHQFVSRLERLEKELPKIRRMHEDSVFHDDPGLYEEALHDACQDFYMEFQELFLAHQAISEKSLSERIDSKAFERKLKDLDSAFRQNFEYFYPIAGLWPAIRTREYNADLWWLTRPPKQESIQEETLSEEMLNILAHACQTSTHTEIQECPRAEQAISYVFGELSLQNRKNFWNHLLVCPVCLDMVLDLRVAEDESRESGETPEETPAWLTGNSMPDTVAPGKDIFDIIMNYIPDLVSIPTELQAADGYSMKMAAGKTEKPNADERKHKVMCAYRLPLTWEKKGGGRYRLLGDTDDEHFMKFYDFLDSGKEEGYWAGLIKKDDGRTEFLHSEEIKDLPCHFVTDKSCRGALVFVAFGQEVLQKLKKFYDQGKANEFLRCLREGELVTISYEEPEGSK